MEIKPFLTRYETKLFDKIAEEVEEKTAKLKEQDLIQNTIKNAKEVIINNIMAAIEELSNRGDDCIMSKADLEKLRVNVDFQDSLLSLKTKKAIEEIIEDADKKRHRIHDMLFDIELRCCYLETPEEVTEVLHTYEILDDDGKLNFKILEGK